MPASQCLDTAARRLAARGTPVLATHEDGPNVPRPRPLGARLARAATAVIRVDCDEGLVRLTAAKGAANLPPLLMDAAGLQTWLRRSAGPRNDR